MNHHVERDRESLRFALDSEAAYIGVLGPRSRYQKLLAGLAAQGYVPSASSLSRVRSPVGLSLGAETPEEVAVSILGRNPGDSPGIRGRVSQRLDPQPSSSGREPALGELVVLRRIDIHQQIGGEVQHQRPVVVPLEHATGPRAAIGRARGRTRSSNRCGGAMTSP